MLNMELDEARKELTNRLQTLRADARQRNQIIDDMTNLYFLRRKAQNMRNEEEKVILNDPMNIVDLAVSILTSNDMRFRAYRLDESQESEQEATQVEKFLRGCFYINNERAETDLQHSITFDMLLKSGVAVRSIWEPSYSFREEQDENMLPDREFDELPIILDVIPLKNVYYKAGGHRGRWQYVIYTDRRSVADILEEWPKVKFDDYIGKANLEETIIDYIDYWGWEDGKIVNAILAENTWVVEPREMEGYTELPYTIFLGKPTTSEKTEEFGLSILSASEHMIKDMETLLERRRRIVNTYTAMPAVVTLKPGKEKPKIDPVLGTVFLDEGESMSFPVWPGSPPDVKEDLAYVQGKVQEGSFPSVAYGDNVGNSGYANSLAAEAGRTRLSQFQRSLELGYTILSRKIISLAQFFARDVKLPVYGRYRGEPFSLQISGAQMAGFRVDVSLRPKFPQDDMRKTTQAIQLKSSKLVSDRSIWEQYLDWVEHPDDEVKRMLVESAMNDPTIKQAFLNKALEDWGIEKPQPQQPNPNPMQRAPQTFAQNTQAQAVAGMPPMMPSPPGLPPAGQMPSQMGGMPMSQEMGFAPPGQQEILPPELLMQANRYLRGTI